MNQTLLRLAGSALTLLAACAGADDLTPFGVSPVIDPSRQSTPAPAQGEFLYYGGRVISNPQVQPVFWGPHVNAGITAGIAGFYKAAVAAKSPYWSWLSEYNTKGVTPVDGGTGSDQTLGFGTVLKPVAITPSFTGTLIDDSDIQAELKAQIHAGHLPKPTQDAGGNDNTYYPIFFPQGVTVTLGGEASCSVFCAYHGTLAADSAAGTPEFYYAVHMDLYPGSPCNGICGGDADPFNDQTAVASHQLATTATDPELGLSVSIGPPLGWYAATSGEIGDICNGQQGTLPGTSYVVQQLWSNELAECIISKSGAVTAKITRPAGGAQVAGTVTIAGTAATGYAGAEISSVSIDLDKTDDLGAAIVDQKAGTFSLSWNSGKLTGKHRLTAKATDSDGHSVTSAAVAVTLDN